MVRNVQKLGCASRDIDSLPENSVESIRKKGKNIFEIQSPTAVLQPLNEQ